MATATLPTVKPDRAGAARTAHSTIEDRLKQARAILGFVCEADDMDERTACAVDGVDNMLAECQRELERVRWYLFPAEGRA